MVATDVSYELRRRGQLDVLAWPAFDGLPVDLLVTSRHGGVSAGPYASLNLGLHVGDAAAAVIENRRRTAAAIGASLGDLVFCNQSHGRDVHLVTAADRGRGTLSQDDAIAATDALVTAEPGIVLVVMVADCVPIVLYDPVARVLSCVHAGWRGTVAGVSQAAVESMAALGSKPADIIAGIGPAVSADRYQVGGEVAAAARQRFGATDLSAVLRPDGTGKWLFDLWRANTIELRRAGLRDGSIHVAAVPTGPAGASPFFSDRAARPCGRFAAVARLRPLSRPFSRTGSADSGCHPLSVSGEDSGVEFDYVVVGAGAAGCVVAGRLALSERRPSVLLVEYGGPARSPLLRVPKGFYYTLRGDRYLYRYLTGPVGPAGKHEVWLRGRVLGGSAAVNGMIWMRGAPADWDGLAARGNPGWSWSHVLPAYRAMEDHSLGASETRGAGGPLGVCVADPGDGVTAAILASAVRYGWPHVTDANAHDTERIAFAPSTIRRGRRITSYDAFVRPALAGRAPAGPAPGRLTVVTRTRCGWLSFDGRRVTGVAVIDAAGAVRAVTARQEVIICAGTVETPLLLERSGIGRPDLLRRHGIEVRAESPQVGERVIEQRGATLQMTLGRTGARARRLSRRTGQAAEALRYLATGRGPLSTGGYDLVCQFKSDPALSRPDVQGLFAPLAIDTSSEELRLASHGGILFMAYPIRPDTTSSVHISGRAPGDPPLIDARFLESQRDRDALAPVIDVGRQVLAEQPAAALIAAEEFPGRSVVTGQDTVDYALAAGTGIYHAVGSAAMGPADDDVVDERLRVRGVTGLRIADASVLPVQVSGNTAAPAMLVGYRAADLVLGED